MLKVFTRVVCKWQMVFLFAIGLPSIALADEIGEVKHQDGVVSVDTPVNEGEEVLVFNGDEEKRDKVENFDLGENDNDGEIANDVVDNSLDLSETKDVDEGVDVPDTVEENTVSDDVTKDEVEVVDGREEEEVGADAVEKDKVKKDYIEELTPAQKAKMVVAAYAKSLAQARDFIKNGKVKDAVELYKSLLKSEIREIRIEALFQLGNIALNIGEVDIAIKYYEKILDIDPSAARVRLELARAYLLKEEWMKADYHFRLVARDDRIPSEVQMNVAAALYYIRQNKNWHFWFNVGAAPDDNVNNATEGEQCIATMFGVFCNKLPDKEKAKGLNVAFGGNHELKLSNHWRLRNEAMVWSSSYDKKKYDDLYVSYLFGPKYVWERGDIFIGPSAYRRWLGHRPYSYAVGGALKANYDFTKHLSFGLNLSFMPTKYDKYPDELNGYTKGISGNIFYGFDVATYLVLRGGYSEEHTADVLYTNNRSNYAFGFGTDLFGGFSIYLEPSVQFTRYLNERWFVKDYEFQKIKEKDILRKYSASISNRKISLFGFTPTLTYTYTDKDSNVWQHEYEKENFELSLQQRF